MALSSFILIIFEHNKRDTIKCRNKFFNSVAYLHHVSDAGFYLGGIEDEFI